MISNKKSISEKMALFFFLGLNFAILTFFALWTTHPESIVRNTGYNTIQFIYFSLGIGTIIGVLLVYFLIEYRAHLAFYEKIIRIISLSTGVFLLGVLATSVNDNWEWWITQTGWFIRQNGWSIGLFLGILMIDTIFLVSRILIEEASLAKKSNKRNTAIIIGFYFVNFSLINEIFVPFGLFQILIYYLALGIICFGIQIIFFIKIKKQVINFTEDIDLVLDSESKNNLTPENEVINSVLPKKRFVKNPHFKLLVISIIAEIVILIISINKEYVSSENYQIIIPIFVGSLFISFWSLGTKYKRTKIWKEVEGTDHDSMYKTFIQFPLKVLKEQFGILWVVLFQLIRVIAPIYLMTSLWYGFPTLFYLPDFLRDLAFWGILGSALYYITKKNKVIRNLVYFLIISSFIILSIFLNNDVINNAFTYYGVDYELIFPFQILLSPYQSFIVGIGSGFIVCYEMNFLFTRYIDKSNLSIRALFISFIPFLIGLLIGLNSVSGVPGGGIGSNTYNSWDNIFIPDPFLESKYLTIFIISLALILVISITDIVFPKIIKFFHTKHTKSTIKWPSKVIISEGNSRQSKSLKKEIAIIGILTAILISGTLFITVPKIKDGYGLPLISSNSAVNVFIAPSNIRISEEQFLLPENENLIPQYNISLARNEYESCQLILKPKARSLNGLRYSISDFVMNDTDSISSSNIQIRYAENVYDTMPEKLVPFSMKHIIEQRNHVLWITAYAPYTAKPGSYLGTLNFTYGNNEWFSLNISLDVWNFTMPDQRHIRSNFGPQTTNADLIETFLNHRINSYGIPLYRAWSLAQLNDENEKYTYYFNDTSGDWVFNWTYYDSQLEYLINNGQNGFYINCPWGMPREPIWVNNNDVNNISEWGIQTGKFYAGLQAHLEDLLVNHSKNWFNYVYVYFIDEFQMFVPEGLTRAEYWDLLEVFLDIINSSAPDVKIMTTTPPSEELEQLNPYIDIYCPVSYDYDAERWNAELDNGKEVWMYACVGPTAPYPNSHTYNRLYEIRVLYWQTWLYKLHGFLYWSTTPYYHGKYGYGYNAWGDAWYIYDEGEGAVYDTIRWENWRDAAEDYEYIWLMNKTIELKGNLAEEVSLLNNIVDRVTGIDYNYCNSGEVVRNSREQIGNWIEDQLKSTSFDLETISELDWNPP